MIYNIIEPVCYQKLTHELAIPNLCNNLGLEYRAYSIEDFSIGKCDIDSSANAIFFTHSAFLRNEKKLKDVRKLIPNGKIVNIGSDSIYFEKYREIEDIEIVDLWLDTMGVCVDYFNDIGIKSEKYYWTISEKFIEEIEKFDYSNIKKNKDYICLGKLNSEYRKELKQKLDLLGFSSTWGNGLISSELPFLGELYASHYICLGTTSPAGNINKKSMKGFRDWIAPFFGTLLIYDYNEEAKIYYDCVHSYNYDNDIGVSRLIQLGKHLYENDRYVYDMNIKKQKEFAKKISIERQLEYILTKHKFIYNV